MAIDSELLRATLRNVSARWQSTETAPVPHALGYIPGGEEISLAMREIMSQESLRQFLAIEGIAPSPLPTSFDWRNVGGKNYITAVRDQADCGSCVAFGCLAAVEAGIRISRKNPGLDVDLSEADLFYCHVGVSGGNCHNGWRVTLALTCLLNSGTVDEKCFPYTPGDQACSKCADWQQRITKIHNWHALTTPGAMKDWIANHGPVVTTFSVYEDFDSYQSGIYHHVQGAFRGGHAVCCVGYNETERFWICKNSWRSGWGEKGFFRIAYGQVGIDATMWAVEV